MIKYLIILLLICSCNTYTPPNTNSAQEALADSTPIILKDTTKEKLSLILTTCPELIDSSFDFYDIYWYGFEDEVDTITIIPFNLDTFRLFIPKSWKIIQ